MASDNTAGGLREPRSAKGILGEKLGMTQVFDENNRIVPVTVVKAGPCVVTQIRTREKDGYSAVQLAYGAIDPRKVTKPVAGHFKAANVTPRRHIVELRTDAVDGYEIGQELGPDVFDAGAMVDVTGTTKGKGTAGVMKRHGFHGLGACTAPSASTGRRARSVRAPHQPACSRACAWPAEWAMSARPRPASWCTRLTPSGACC